MPNERLYCPECGASNEADAGFCESCGHSLAQTDAPIAATDEPAYEENVEAPPAGRRLSPKILALVGIVVIAGAAYALRAPIASMLASNKGADTTTVASDSLQLIPSVADPQLNDRGVADTQFVVSPETLERVTGGRQPVITMRATPKVQNPRSERSQPTDTRTGQSNRAMPLPEAPPDFPDFKTPPGVTGSTGGSTSSGSTGDARVNHDGPPPRAAAGRIAAGSVLSLKSASQVCSDKTQQGARFTAVVQQDVTGSNGATIPAGTQVTFVVDRLKRAQIANEKSEFSVAPESIQIGGDRQPLSATVDAVTIKQKSRSLFGALAGAAVAAAAAKAAGGDTKQTIAGAAAGGAAGAVIGNQMRGGDGCIEKNALIRITLASDISM